MEETEPSIYEGASDYGDDSNQVVGKNNKKKSKYTIDYDNKDIYTTSNNYAPYNLEDAHNRSMRPKSRKH